MKSKILSAIMIALLVTSGISGLSIDSNAAGNVEDKSYAFDNRNSSSDGKVRAKYNNTKVYVYPTAGPAIYYTVYGGNNDSGSGFVARSNTVKIPQGTQGSITNTANEMGNTYVFLRFTRITYSYTTTSGVWSPDSTKNYVIFN